MLLGQRLNNVSQHLGQKIKPTLLMGNRVFSDIIKYKNVINNIDNEVKKTYSNLEKLNARKKLH